MGLFYSYIRSSIQKVFTSHLEKQIINHDLIKINLHYVTIYINLSLNIIFASSKKTFAGSHVVTLAAFVMENPYMDL